MFRGKSVCLSNIVFGKCLTSSFCPGKQLYFFVIWLTAHQTNIRLSRPFSVFLSAVQAPFPTIPVGCISGCPLFFSLSFHIDSKSIFRSPPFPLFWNRLGEDQRPIELHDDPEGVGLRAPIQARRAFFLDISWFDFYEVVVVVNPQRSSFCRAAHCRSPQILSRIAFVFADLNHSGR